MAGTLPDAALRVDLVFPRFKLLSGAERLILELAAGLARAGQRPRLVCHQFDDSCRPLVGPGVEVHISGRRLDWFANRYLNALFDYARALSLARHVDRDADAVILFGPALALAWYLRAIRRRPTRFVYHCFEPPRVLYQDRREVLGRAGTARVALGPLLAIYRAVDRALTRWPHAATTAPVPSARDKFRAAYGHEATSIAHGIDRARLDAAPRPDAPTVDLVTANYLHPRKRVDLIVRAVAAAPGAPTLEIVGDGPERASLEALAVDLGVGEQVRVAGFVPEAELASRYLRARCYVHATRDETFGLSLIEAAYCGLPVVSVAEGGAIDNVIDGVTGRLVEATPAALAGAIDEILRNPARAGLMGAAGRAHVAERYDWDRGASDLLAVIRGTL